MTLGRLYFTKLDLAVIAWFLFITLTSIFAGAWADAVWAAGFLALYLVNCGYHSLVREWREMCDRLLSECREWSKIATSAVAESEKQRRLALGWEKEAHNAMQMIDQHLSELKKVASSKEGN